MQIETGQINLGSPGLENRHSGFSFAEMSGVHESLFNVSFSCSVKNRKISHLNCSVRKGHKPLLYPIVPRFLHTFFLSFLLASGDYTLRSLNVRKKVLFSVGKEGPKKKRERVKQTSSSTQTLSAHSKRERETYRETERERERQRKRKRERES